MKIVATLLVRNEAPLVADCLQHHLQQGVTGFLITDHASQDGLADVLKEYQDVILEVRHETDDRYLQDQWVSRMARKAADFRPDWILHLDADERWCGLDALHHVPPHCGWIRTGAWRNHLPLTISQPAPFRSGMMPYFEIPGRTAPHAPRFVEFGTGIGGKILHRPLPNAVVGMGNHWLHSPILPSLHCDAITVHHYPIRSLEQFRRKVVNGAAALDAGALPAEIGIHWRAWRDLNQQGLLEQVYDSFLLTDAEIRNRLVDGTLHFQSC